MKIHFSRYTFAIPTTIPHLCQKIFYVHQIMIWVLYFFFDWDDREMIAWEITPNPGMYSYGAVRNTEVKGTKNVDSKKTCFGYNVSETWFSKNRVHLKKKIPI